MNGDQMNCEQASERLSERLDGELAPADAAALDAHLAGCADCTAAAEALRRQDADLRAALAPHRAAAERVGQSVVARLRSEPNLVATPVAPATTSTAPRSALRRWPGLIAAVAAGFVIGAWVYRPMQENSNATFSKVSGSLSSQPQTSLPQASLTKPVAANPTVATLVVATGNVEMKPADGADFKSYLNVLTCPSDSVIRTGAASCELKTVDGHVIRLNKETEVALKSADSIEVLRGQVWCASPDTSRDAAPLKVAVGPASPGDVQVTSAKGDVTLRTAAGDESLKGGESASVVAGQVVRAPNDPLLSTAWMSPLLIRKGSADPELADRIDQILAQLGQSKLSHLYEQEIRALGEHAVMPLARYVQSPLSKQDPPRRATAMRIIADIAPTWAIGTLIELLTDDDPQTRVLAAQALRRLTGETQGREPEEWREEPAKSPTKSAEALELWRRWWTERRDKMPTRRDDA
jgi:hypothetical protein